MPKPDIEALSNTLTLKEVDELRRKMFAREEAKALALAITSAELLEANLRILKMGDMADTTQTIINTLYEQEKKNASSLR